jgi:predicted unusual protein kinase regulating ubiquinone biosynthesis (AarF/ABC1/UbiB family)
MTKHKNLHRELDYLYEAQCCVYYKTSFHSEKDMMQSALLPNI